MATRTPGSKPRYYIDSCVFIEVIKGRTHTGLDNPEHYDNCLQLMNRLQEHEIEVYASTLVYVEVFNRGELRLRDNTKSQTASARRRQEAGDLIEGLCGGHDSRGAAIFRIAVGWDRRHSRRTLPGKSDLLAMRLARLHRFRCTAVGGELERPQALPAQPADRRAHDE